MEPAPDEETLQDVLWRYPHIFTYLINDDISIGNFAMELLDEVQTELDNYSNSLQPNNDSLQNRENVSSRLNMMRFIFTTAFKHILKEGNQSYFR